MKKIERESGIELLKIIMMIQVVFLHISSHGGYADNAAFMGETHQIIYNILFLGSRYMMITWFIIYGYFSIEKELTIKDALSRFKKNYIPIIFYSIIIGLLFLIFKPIKVNVWHTLIKSFTPLLSNSWYFLTNYIIITMLSPFINRSVKNIDKKSYIYLLLFFILIFIWRTLAINTNFFKNIFNIKYVITGSSKDLITFLFMYLLGGFIKKYIPKNYNKRFYYLACFFGLCVFNLIIYYSIDPYTFDIAGRQDNIIIILEGVMMLLFFRELKFKSSFINMISNANIGVYLIHDHPLVRKYLWGILPFKSHQFYLIHSSTYILYIFIAIVLIYIICNIIEQIRIRIFAVILKRKTNLKIC